MREKKTRIVLVKIRLSNPIGYFAVEERTILSRESADCSVGSLPAEGLEPTRSCDHWILSPARLPVPPRRRRKREATRLAAKLKRFRRDRAAVNFLAVREFREE
jgi:hypothetical protein